MADLKTPFAQDAEKRYPTPTERANGLPCGPADQALFNGLFHRLEAEVGDVIDYAGIDGSDADFTQLRQAILALISAATGGNPAGYILMSQARARLPIFPQVLNADGRIVVTSPATGQVRLPGGVNFLHRGIYQETTTQTDFNTDPSKTYHLRWDPTNGFRLLDLAGATYNPTALVETNVIFDSKYDDMLIARVVTNSSNVPTITNLSNLDRLFFSIRAQGTGTPTPGNETYGRQFVSTQNINWARTPVIKAVSGAVGASGVSPGGAMDGVANSITKHAVTRYSAGATISTDWDGATLTGIFAYLDFDLAA